LEWEFLWAIVAAMMMSLGTGILTKAFPSQEHSKVLGVVSSLLS